MSKEPALPFEIGETCADRYRIQRLIGRGGMGVVYEAEHCFTRAQVALKVLYEAAGDLPERMAREARALARIEHRHVVRVLDGGVMRGRIVWFAMQRLRGRTLRQVLTDEGRLAVDRALRYARQVAEGAAAVHALGIVHRDLKPENTFIVEPQDEVRILDFGTAKFRTGEIPKTTDRLRVQGTYAYLAPERLMQASKGDERCDIYALGHMLYEMLAGRHCFSDGPGALDLPPPLELSARQIAAQPKSIRTYRRGIAPRLDALVLAMLEKPLHHRPASMNEVVARLDRIADASDARRARRPSSPEAASAAARAEPTERATPRPPTPGRSTPLPSALERQSSARPSSPDWLAALRSTEYVGLPSLEAQAVVGAARFACRESRGRAEQTLAMALCRDPDPETTAQTQALCIAMISGTAQQQGLLRNLMYDWAFSLNPVQRAALGARLSQILRAATAAAPHHFVNDALMASRITYGASLLVPYEARDHAAISTLFELPRGSFEDIQLAVFALLLLTRGGDEQRARVRGALKALVVDDEAERYAGRVALGELLGSSLRDAAPAADGASNRAHPDSAGRGRSLRPSSAPPPRGVSQPPLLAGLEPRPRGAPEPPPRGASQPRSRGASPPPALRVVGDPLSAPAATRAAGTGGIAERSRGVWSAALLMVAALGLVATWVVLSWRDAGSSSRSPSSAELRQGTP